MTYVHPIEFVVIGLARYLLNDIALFFDDLLIDAREFIDYLPNNISSSRLVSLMLLLDGAWWFINSFPISELISFTNLLAGTWGVYYWWYASVFCEFHNRYTGTFCELVIWYAIVCWRLSYAHFASKPPAKPCGITLYSHLHL